MTSDVDRIEQMPITMGEIWRSHKSLNSDVRELIGEVKTKHLHIDAEYSAVKIRLEIFDRELVEVKAARMAMQATIESLRGEQRSLVTKVATISGGIATAAFLVANYLKFL